MVARTLLLLVTGLFVNLSIAKADPVTLALKFPPGQTDKMTLTSEMQQTFSSDQLPAPVRQTMNQTTEFALRVVDVKASGATMELTYNRLRTSVNMAGQQIAYDSDKDKEGDNPLAGPLSVVVGHKILLHFDAKGKLEKVAGMNDLTEKMAKKPGGEAAAAQLKQAFNDEQLKTMLAQAWTDFLPTNPVSLNDKWSSNTAMNLTGFGDIKLKMNMRLAAIEERSGHKLAKVEVNAKGTLEGSAGAAGVKLKADEITQHGTIYFDIDRGWMADQNLEQLMKGTARVNTPNGQEVEMKFEQQMKLAVRLTPGK